MGTYEIPRNYGGETRILYIFTIKSLITTAMGAALGSIFFFIFRALDMVPVGLVIMAIFGLIGFALGAFKIPKIVAIPITKKISGEPVSEIIFRYFKYKKNRKLYRYMRTKEEK